MEGLRTGGRPRMGMIEDLTEEPYVNMKRGLMIEIWRSWLPRSCQKVANL